MPLRPILFFDSGIGGLTILRETRIKIPERPFIYVADDANFPYGTWPDKALKEHIITLLGMFLEKHKPLLCVIACNTASTIVLDDLRKIYPKCLFVGTVPAIKPAAQQTRSGFFTVLATKGTVERSYTQSLINLYAQQKRVTLVGSKRLALLAEDYLFGRPINEQEIAEEIAPCFIHEQGYKTDIIVLACTHYPFLVNVFRRYAPWPVDWLEPSEAIAKHIRALLPPYRVTTEPQKQQDTAYFTSGHVPAYTQGILNAFGLKYSPIS